MDLITRMSTDLNIDKDFIFKISKQASFYYKKFDIVKNGKRRTIHHPSPVLKTFQYWIVNNLFIYIPISEYSCAYTKGCSIKKNATLHLCKNHILHLDIKDFFPSITYDHVETLIQRNINIITQKMKIDQITELDRDVIISLCVYNGALTIGSVCSPTISNSIMYDFDINIGAIMKQKGIIYSRYADDMVFSSNNKICEEVINDVKQQLLKLNMRLNENKTYFMSNKGRKKITGIIINDNKLSVGKKKRDSIKKMLYKKLEYNIGNSNEILGHLYFLNDIEPDFFDKLIIKYSKYGNILEILKKSI